MTWRRFSTLLRGLGPNSASAARAYDRKHAADGAVTAGNADVPAIATPEQATSAFVSLFAGRGIKRSRGRRHRG